MKYKFLGDLIETRIIEITLDPEFKVEVEKADTNWRYTILQVFGDYKYKNVGYQYRVTDADEWITITGNIFETMEQKSYEIRAMDMDQADQPEIQRFTS